MIDFEQPPSSIGSFITISVSRGVEEQSGQKKDERRLQDSDDTFLESRKCQGQGERRLKKRSKTSYSLRVNSNMGFYISNLLPPEEKRLSPLKQKHNRLLKTVQTSKTYKSLSSIKRVPQEKDPFPQSKTQAVKSIMKSYEKTRSKTKREPSSESTLNFTPNSYFLTELEQLNKCYRYSTPNTEEIRQTPVRSKLLNISHEEQQTVKMKVNRDIMLTPAQIRKIVEETISKQAKLRETAKGSVITVLNFRSRANYEKKMERVRRATEKF